MDVQYQRNAEGIEHEKAGNIDEAILLYEKNIEEGFEGNHPYDRLIILYRKLGRHEDVRRVLRRAIFVFENLVFANRADRVPKLEKYKEKLKKLG